MILISSPLISGVDCKRVLALLQYGHQVLENIATVFSETAVSTSSLTADMVCAVVDVGDEKVLLSW